MPPSAAPIDWEFALVMPLGVLAHQLVKIEGDLRFLAMKATEHAGEGTARPTRAVDARLDLIHESLDAIKAQLVRLQADLHPRQTPSQPRETPLADDRVAKPLPEQDD